MVLLQCNGDYQEMHAATMEEISTSNLTPSLPRSKGAKDSEAAAAAAATSFAIAERTADDFHRRAAHI